jgi:hypothetical protein
MPTLHKSLAILLTALALAGCATADRVCDVTPWARENTAQIAPSGDIRLKWRVVSKAEIGGYCGGAHVNGCAHVVDGFAVLYIADRPQFSNTCQLATFGEELAHAMGAQHGSDE